MQGWTLSWWQTVLTEARAAGDWAGPWCRLPLAGVSIDSRTVRPGELFVAIAGPHFDGHDFIDQALAAGCAGVLAERLPEELPVPGLVVADTTLALAQAARAWRQRVNPVVVAVTGSSGKTSVKEMLAACLRERFRVHATQGNLNNHLGVPLTLLRMPADCERLVVEMGMSHAGEIAQLTAIALPDVGVVTNVQPAHAGSFADLTGVARAKGELLAGLSPEALGVIPWDSPYRALLQSLAAAPLVTFGSDPWADYQLLARTVAGEGMTVEVRRGERSATLTLAAVGEHVARNALAALAAAEAAGLDWPAAVAGLAKFRLPAGRGERQEAAAGWTVLNDTYNANPGSLNAALAALGEQPAKRRVAILGDALELGEQGEAWHRELAGAVAASGVALLLTSGPQMRFLHEAAAALAGLERHYREDPAHWLGQVVPLLQAGDLVLVKGSRGMRMERIVADILRPA